MRSRRSFSTVSFGLVFAVACQNAALAAAATLLPTTTELTISPENGVAAGNLVTLNASVSSLGGSVSPGLVLFCNAAVAYCEDLNILGQAQLMANGSASLHLILPIGLHQIRAEFKGTKNYGPSSSSTESLLVSGKFATASTIASTQGLDTYTLTSTITSFGAQAPTGTEVFKDTANHLLPLASSMVGPFSLMFTQSAAPTESSTLQSGAVADFNRDGKLDQILFDIVNNDVVVLLGNGDGTFTAGPIIPVGSSPDGIAVGDFNNDDIPDFAVLNDGDRTVSIFLGNGDGSFSAPKTISLGPSLGYISSGDFNNDGNADLVISTQSGMWTLLGNGEGGFTILSAPQIVEATSPIVVADFNGDGNEDLVFADQIYPVIYFGNGDGTFTAGTVPTYCDPLAGSYCENVVVADFNNDGKPDLAIASYGEGVSVLLGNGDGTFGNPAPIGGRGLVQPFNLCLGDFNGDGIVDICESDSLETAENNLDTDIFLGSGDGTFNNGFLEVFSLPLAVGDFNGDGMSDLVTGTLDGNPTTVSLAGWQTTVAVSGTTLTGSFGIHNVFADYEGDLTHAPSVSGVSTLQGPKAATTIVLDASPTPIAPGEAMRLAATVAPSVASGDTVTGMVTFSNGPSALATVAVTDGRAILSTTSLPVGSNISLTAYYSGNTDFSPSISLPVHLTTQGRLRPVSITRLSLSPAQKVSRGTVVTLSAQVFDAANPLSVGVVNFYCTTSAHPGKTNLGQAQLTPAGIATLKFRPPIGSLQIQASYQGTNTHAGSESAWQSLAVTGQIDTSTAISLDQLAYSATVMSYGLLVPTGNVSFSDASNSVFATASLSPSSTEFSLSKPSLQNLGTGQIAEAVGDFNNDGILDLAISTQSNELLILVGNPDGTFVQKFSANLTGSATSIVVADFNSDGIPDLAVLQSASQGSVAIFLGLGDGTFIKQTPLEVGANPVSLATGDFNGDGSSDLLITNSTGTVTLLLNDGDGAFHAGPSANLGAEPMGAAIVADFNGDGITDVASAVQGSSNSISLLLGKGDGTFVTLGMAAATRCSSITLTEADFNGDGVPDILFAGCENNFTMLLGNGNGTFTSWELPQGSYESLALATADLNSDGIPDLVQTEKGDSEVHILFGQGDGTFGSGLTVPIPNGGVANGIAVGDFNGDGVPDIVTADGPNSLTGDAPVSTSSEWLSSITQISQATAMNVTLPGSGTQQVYAIYPGDATHVGSVSPTVSAGSPDASHQKQ